MIYECTITYAATDEKGCTKTQKEKYIVENVCMFSDAETLLYKVFDEHIDVDVVALKRSKLMEIVNTDSDGSKIFFATIVSHFITENGDDKQTKYVVALFADDIQSAQEKTKDYMRQGLQDMDLIKIAETNYLGVLE